MRVFNKASGDQFVRAMAERLKGHAERRVIAAAVDLKEEATQSAQAYWMMGWSWDEIETVLEDSDYPAAVISSAIKSTKEYANKILNEGPFSVLKMGQRVCLVNGSSGKISKKEASHIVVNIPGVGETRVEASQLDTEATGKLREAHALRMRAARMVVATGTDDIGYIKSAAKEVPSNPMLQAVGDALSSIAALQHAADDLKHDAAELHSRWNSEHGDWSPSSPQENEFAQYVYAMLTVEKDLDSEIKNNVHIAAATALTNLYNAMAQGGSLDPSIEGFITHEFPHIVSSLDTHLYNIRRANKKTQEYVQHFEKFDVDSGKAWPAEAVRWASDAWTGTKEFLRKWENEYLPTLTDGIGAVNAVVTGMQNSEVAASVSAALKSL